MNTENTDEDKDPEEKSAFGKPFSLKVVIFAVLVYVFAFNLYLLLKS